MLVRLGFGEEINVLEENGRRILKKKCQIFKVPFLVFLRLFCRMRNRSLVSEREFTRLVGRSVDPWVVNVCLYFR